MIPVHTIAYLIAHTNPNGTGPAQALIRAASLKLALRKFDELFPGRTVLAVGREGDEGEES